MRITFVLKESIYDCKIKITDSHGERYYDIPASREEGVHSPSIIAEVFDTECSLSIIPMPADIAPILNELEENDWKDKLAKKATRFLMNSLDKIILRVGCDYHITDLQDGDRLDITLQDHIMGTPTQFEILEFIPMFYSFFEVSNFNSFYKLTSAYEINRKDVLKFARTFAFSQILGNGWLATLVIYPIQVSRMKRLSKNKKIRKVLIKFNNLSDEKRQRFLEKQEKILEKF